MATAAGLVYSEMPDRCRLITDNERSTKAWWLNEARAARKALLDWLAENVDEGMIETMLHARVPGGAEAWHWLPQTIPGGEPHQTARNVISCAFTTAVRHLNEREE